MDIRLDQGDFAVGVNGPPGSARGGEEFLQWALIRPTVSYGSFSYDPEPGSRLYTLVMPGVDLSARTHELMEEVLTALPGVSVEQVVYILPGGGRACLVVELSTSLGPGTIPLELTGQEG